MELAITSLGMISSVGHGVVPACAAIRAGIVRPQPLRSFQVLTGQPIEEVPLIAHPVEDYTEGFLLVGRWLRLASGALGDLLKYGKLPDRRDSGFWRRTGLIAAIPFPEAESLSGNSTQDLALLKRAYVLPLVGLADVPIQPEHTHLIWSGHVGAIEAVCHAQRMLEAGYLERVIVLAADSYLDESLLGGLLEQRRLKTPSVPCGLMPGEAAACFMVEPQWRLRARGVPAEAVIRAATTAQDVQFSLTGSHTGTVLAQVLETVLDLAGHTSLFAGDVHTDLNGENWRASHVANAQIRLAHRFSSRIQIRITALSLGDVGAASGAVSLCVACRSYRRGYALSDTSLILNLSERGSCGAMLLEHKRN